MSASDCNCSKS
ncbi:hypothetical protein SS209_01376 [Salmonella enterica subsp. enterica serovar Senftenberg str. SS209]|nr:hypothetical protein SS209_01376 [Salmonella enterica subsp. enterica serovar Senftenberg str. SS209]